MHKQNNITPEEATEAGLTPEDAMREIAQWNYDVPASAKSAYRGGGIETLQLLRQIKYLLTDDKIIELRKMTGHNIQKPVGISPLYNALEEGRGSEMRKAAAEDGGLLQSWKELGSSKELRKFVKKHDIFLGGKIADDDKWHPDENISSNGINKTLSSEGSSGSKETVKKKISEIPPRNATPGTVESKTTQHCRDTETKLWILRYANGRCECCHKEAPFLTSEGRPYLEVHHVIPLSEGGADTTENAVAVCPNCHRELHHGQKKEELKYRLYQSIDRLRSSCEDGYSRYGSGQHMYY